MRRIELRAEGVPPAQLRGAVFVLTAGLAAAITTVGSQWLAVAGNADLVVAGCVWLAAGVAAGAVIVSIVLLCRPVRPGSVYPSPGEARGSRGPGRRGGHRSPRRPSWKRRPW